jgi:hypothetical protein
MLKMGVPMPAVGLKMKAEGLDPALLECVFPSPLPAHLAPRRQSPRSNSLIFVQSFWCTFARALVGLLFNIPAGHLMPQLLLEKKKRTIKRKI